MLSTVQIVILGVGVLVGVLAFIGTQLSTGDPYSDSHTERGEPPSPHGQEFE